MNCKQPLTRTTATAAASTCRCVTAHDWRRQACRHRWVRVGGSYDNALAESIIGLYKTEVIERQGWCGAGDVELSTLEWVDWFNQRRLLSSIGYTPPVEFEAAYYRQKTD